MSDSPSSVVSSKRSGLNCGGSAGSHYIYSHPKVPRPLSIQSRQREAKPYQILQFLGMVEEYNPDNGASAMTPRYHINLFWSEADGAGVADVPDLQSCSAFGDSRLRHWPKLRRRWRRGRRPRAKMVWLSPNRLTMRRRVSPPAEMAPLITRLASADQVGDTVTASR
jgi:hypothetical protein